ncbi:trypsin-like serine peptidase [Streptomyces bauhiniae]
MRTIRRKPVLLAVVGCAVALLAVAGLTGLPARLVTGSSGQAGRLAADWRDWNPATWGRDNSSFLNPVVDGLWDSDRMRKSGSADRPVSRDVGVEKPGLSDPEPAPVTAEPVPAPYSKNAPIVGKLFFDTPEGPSVCSATVVSDPAHPGASDLVWTAGHCVHAGAGGGWYRNIVFVPTYNDQAATQTAGTGREQLAPSGVWWADGARTSQQWISQGRPTGGDGSPFDFAVLHVRRTGTASSASLEETVGAAADISFTAPRTQDISTMGLWGYPAVQPFDGERMFTCRSRPGRLSVKADQPSLYRVGCTMTGGSSGGGWFIEDANGKPVLVSNTSIGPDDQIWLAGPRLGSEARSVYETLSGQFAGQD